MKAAFQELEVGGGADGPQEVVNEEGERATVQFPKGWTSRPVGGVAVAKRSEAKAEKGGGKVREAARVTWLQRNFVWAEGCNKGYVFTLRGEENKKKKKKNFLF